jgi:putative FmdB family regulatory protein
MPIYEYKCQDCGHELEAMQKASDPPKKKCPKCGGRLSKLISAPAIQFKGGGWYVTDYAGKAGGVKNPKESRDKAADDGSKKSEDKKSDAAPAAKKD